MSDMHCGSHSGLAAEFLDGAARRLDEDNAVGIMLGGLSGGNKSVNLDIQSLLERVLGRQALLGQGVK